MSLKSCESDEGLNREGKHYKEGKARETFKRWFIQAGRKSQ